MSGPVRPPLEVTEVDGSPDGRPINKIVVSNGDLSISGTTATIDTSGAGGTAALTDTYVGFGDSSDLLSGSSKFTWVDTAGSEKLTITGSNTSDTAGTVKIVNTDNSASSAPDIIFYHDRGTGNAANGDYLGQFVFSGRNSANNEAGYVRMFARASNVTSGDEDGQWFMQCRVDGTYRSFQRLQGSSGKGYVTFNEDGIDTDFRIECLSSASGIDTANAVKLDGATGNLGLGVATATPALHIKRDNTITDMNSSGAAGITIEQDGTGDAALSFLLTGTMRWMMGVDNNDSNKLKFATGGTDLSTGTKVTLDTNGYVGIGEDSPATELHVKGDSTAAGITIESTEAASGAGAPDLILYRNKGTSTAVNDDLGEIRWQCNTADGTKEEFASIYCEAASVTNGQESSRMRFYGKYLGSSLEYFRLDRNAIVFNELDEDIDIRMESVGNAYAFMLNSNENVLGVFANPSATIHGIDVSSGDASVADDNPVVRVGSYYSGGELTALELANYHNDANSDVKFRMTSFAGTNSDFEIVHNSFGHTAFRTNQPNTDTVEQFTVALTSVVVNEGGADIDFRVEGDSDVNLIATNAADDVVGIGAAPVSTGAKLQVDEDASYYRWVISQKTENHDVTAAEAHGGVLSMKASATGSRTFTLPATGVIGMHCSFINMSTNGMDIAVDSSSSHKINNGGSAGNSTTAVYTTISQRVDLIYIEANQWVATLGTLASVS